MQPLYNDYTIQPLPTMTKMQMNRNAWEDEGRRATERYKHYTVLDTTSLYCTCFQYIALYFYITLLSLTFYTSFFSWPKPKSLGHWNITFNCQMQHGAALGGGLSDAQVTSRPIRWHLATSPLSSATEFQHLLGSKKKLCKPPRRCQELKNPKTGFLV